MEYTEREQGFREKLLNNDTYFGNDQIEAVMQVVKDSVYSDMYEALKAITTQFSKLDKLYSKDIEVILQANLVLLKAEGGK